MAATTSRLFVCVVSLLALLATETAQAGPLPRSNPFVQASQPYVPGEIIVRYKAGTTDAAMAQSLSTTATRVRGNNASAMQLTILRRYTAIDAMGRTIVRLTTTGSVEETIAALKNDPDVASASPNQYVHLDAVTPDDPEYALQWGLSNTGQVIRGTAGTAGADISAVDAWELRREAPEVVVAVIDTGIDLGHEDLVGNIWVNAAETPDNGLDDDGNGVIDDVNGYNTRTETGDVSDGYGHGTHVAGIIGAVANNAKGVAGVAWNVKLMPVRCFDDFGSTSVADIIEAFDYAIAQRQRGVNIRVINASLGMGTYNESLEQSVGAAIDAGILVVCSAGNQGYDLAVNPMYPAAFALAGLVSVAATDNQDNLATFSNLSKNWVVSSAPGVDILSTVPGILPEYPDNHLRDTMEAAGGWETTGTWAQSDNQAASGTKCYEDSPDGNTPAATFHNLILDRDVNLLGATNTRRPFVAFRARYDLGEHGRMRVSYSRDGGETWTGFALFRGASEDWSLKNLPVPPEFWTDRFRVSLAVETGSAAVPGMAIDDFAVGFSGKRYDYKSGTSMASPHVAGAAALLVAEKPELSPAALAAAMRLGVDELASLRDKVIDARRLNLQRLLEDSALGNPVLFAATPTRSGGLALSGFHFGQATGRVFFPTVGDDKAGTPVSWSSSDVQAKLPAGVGRSVFLERADNVRSRIVNATFWRPAPALPEALSDVGAAAWDDTVYVCGGYKPKDPMGVVVTATCQAYNPDFGTWYAIPSMGMARCDHALVALDGKLYALGGWDENGPIASVEVYDIAARTWSPAPALPQALAGLRAVAAGGRLYVSGGNPGNGFYSSTTLYEYEPGRNSWQERAPMTAWRYHHGFVAANGRLYAFGGIGYETTGANYLELRTVESFSPATNTWRRERDMPLHNPAIPGDFNMAHASDGRYIVAVNGVHATVTDRLDTAGYASWYDPASNSWKLHAANLFAPSANLSSSAMVYLPNHGFYLIGGQYTTRANPDTPTVTKAVSSVYAWNIDTPPQAVLPPCRAILPFIMPLMHTTQGGQ